MSIEIGSRVQILYGPYSGQTATVTRVFGDNPRSFIEILTQHDKISMLVCRKWLAPLNPPTDIVPDDTIWGY